MLTERYDAKKDPMWSEPVVDVQEKRTRHLTDGRDIPFWFVHGSFRGTPVKFTFCYPLKEAYEGRFYQYLSPFPGPDEEMVSYSTTGVDDKIGFCLTHGAYFIETNLGSPARFGNSPDPDMTPKSSAAAAEFSREKACEIYGYKHRPYGYVYGGSGGGYRTIGCIENTNAFDGAIPYVIGSPYAIPNCQTTRAYAERVLRHNLKRVADCYDAGGSGHPEEFLTGEEQAALQEATLFGYPRPSWFASVDGDDGALPVLLPGIKQRDPAYFTDFWEKPGYEGTNPEESARRDRIHFDTKVRSVFLPGKSESEEQKAETRDGVNDAWRKMLADNALAAEPYMTVDSLPDQKDPYYGGTILTFTSGNAKGKKLHIQKVEDGRLYFSDWIGMDPIADTLGLVSAGDMLTLDNSDYIAVQYYHRHQVPTPDYHAWDQFRDADHRPVYPQRPALLGPQFTSGGTGCSQTGRVACKIIIVAGLMDEQAYPWQADWYRRKVASVRGGNDADYLRLWYFDNAFHGDVTEMGSALRAAGYIGGLRQGLLDLAAWVEKGIAPVPSTNYTLHGGCVSTGATAEERGGIQPVASLTADGSKCVHIHAGDTVQFSITGAVPAGTGSFTSLEWSFENEETFTPGSWTLSENGEKGVSAATHTYSRPGTYFATARFTAERHGDKAALYTQVRNLDRVRVVVE